MAASRPFGMVAGIVVALSLSGVTGCGSDVPDRLPPELLSLSPTAADFREAATIELVGTGFASDVRVWVGEVEADVEQATDSHVLVKLPAPYKPRRDWVRVVSGGHELQWKEPFVFRGMAPDAIRFVPRAEAGPAADAVVPVDLDGDGLLDLVTSTAAGLTWRKGDGALVFASPAGEPMPGLVPLAVLPSMLGRSGVLVRGEAVFGSIRWTGEALAVQSVETSGRPLAIAVTSPDHVLAVVRVDANVSLVEVVFGGEAPVVTTVRELGTSAPTSLSIGDVDGDGNADLLLGSDAGLRLLAGDGTGAYRDAAPGTFPAEMKGNARFVDVTADGRPDIVLGAADGDRVLWNVDGRFLDRTQAALGLARERSVLELDVDADGATDLLARGDSLLLRRNDGLGRFFDYSARALPFGRGWLPRAVADLDGDLDPDLIALDPQGRLRVLQNWAPQPFADPDDDGVPSSLDVCPDVADPAQSNRDANPFACPDAACATEPGCRFVVDAARALLVCTPRPYADALVFCRNRGATLPLPTDADSSLAIGAVAANVTVWLGISDQAEEGVFRDVSDQPLAYTNWNPGEPNDASGEDCAELAPNGTWNDIPCTIHRTVVCVEAPVRVGDVRGDACDVCPLVSDPLQSDTDANGVGDLCEAAP